MKIKLNAYETVEVIEKDKSIEIIKKDERSRSQSDEKMVFNEQNAYMVGNILKEWAEKKSKEW